MIFNIIIFIFLCCIFFYIDENEEKYEFKLYFISSFELLINVINIILSSITLDYCFKFLKHIFKFINSDIYDKYKNPTFISINIIILIVNILLLVSVWVYYYYIKRDLYDEKKWKIITFLKKEKYALFLCLMFINLIIFILICVLLSKKE